MTSKEAASYQPLSRTSESTDDLPMRPFNELPSTSFWTKISKARWALLCMALLLSNSVWAGLLWRYRQTHANDKASNRDGSFSQLTAFHWHTPFSNDNKTLSNPLWAGLFPQGAGLVTVEKSWAAANRLPLSRENPADSNSMVYFVAGFHQLHCLTVLRASLYHFQEQREQTVPWMHVTHCLDSLRQLVQCNADGALLYTEDANIFGDGQVHECNDWGGLGRWAAEHAFEQDL